MKKCSAILFLALSFTAGLSAQDESDPELISPDGRFVFHAYSSEDADSGKTPAFGIIERASGKLVSDPKEELGDAFRPEESILWAPDSRAYALTTRVGTRHLDTFLYRWDGKAFRRAKWEGGASLEAAADQRVTEVIRARGSSKDARRGRTIAGDSLAERWIDPRRLVMSRVEECVVGDGDDEEDTVSGEARALVVWNEKEGAYEIDKMLPVAESWPAEVEETPGFEVKQTDVPGDDSNARKIAVLNRESNETKTFTADGWMTAPTVLVAENGWPQIELHSHGPGEFVWRKLYRVENGAYRCVRIDEMTRLAHQAPEGAPLVEISPSYGLHLIRTRHPKAGEADAFESFSVETVSPDGKWKTVSLYTPHYLERVSIVDVAGAAEPVVLYDFDSGEGGVNTICQTLWSPDSQALAFFAKLAPRVGETLLYRRSNRVWSKAAMPKIHYSDLRKPATADWRDKFESPLWWNGSRELTLELWGSLEGDEPIDYHAYATLRWSESGKPAGSVTTPQRIAGSE